MKKIYMVVQRKDVEAALESLQEFGSVHVESQQKPLGQELIILREDAKGVKEILTTLSEYKDKPKQETLDQWESKVDRVLDAIEQSQNLKEKIAKRETRIKAWEPWGNFDPAEIKKLSRHDVFVKLYQKPVKEKLEVPGDIAVEKIFTAGGMDYLVAVMRRDESLDMDIVTQPRQGLNEMKRQQEEDKNKLKEAEATIKGMLKYQDSLKEILKGIEQKLQFHEVKEGMKREGGLIYLKGFCPSENVKKFEDKAKAEKWAVIVEEPGADDHVPTLLRNPKWVELSKPALNMIEILPGYKEIDVSPVFMIFFTLFFGMLIGDAGYGLLYAIGAFILYKKTKYKLLDKTSFLLIYLLTGFTFFWGVLTGTYFGQEWLPEGINPVLPWLNDSNNIILLCFTIALAHLSIARIWAFLVKWPSTTAWAECGWLLIVWGMYFLANMFVLGHAFPVFAKWFFIAGITLAFFFMVPFKDFAKKVPQEVVPFILGIIGAGTDIVSYVRLFAVGLATVAVADAANNMLGAPLPFGFNYFLFGFLHILNMGLALMAILVHDVRLNVLEFSGHLSLEWAGVKYSPFKKELKQA